VHKLTTRTKLAAPGERQAPKLPVLPEPCWSMLAFDRCMHTAHQRGCGKASCHTMWYVRRQVWGVHTCCMGYEAPSSITKRSWREAKAGITLAMVLMS
jgi:hypothetical protein